MSNAGILAASIANGLMPSEDGMRVWRQRLHCIICVSGSMSNAAGHAWLLPTWWLGNLMGLRTKRCNVMDFHTFTLEQSLGPVAPGALGLGIHLDLCRHIYAPLLSRTELAILPLPGLLLWIA
jgi:hypothetical protein